jgi:hypothetical protein
MLHTRLAPNNAARRQSKARLCQARPAAHAAVAPIPQHDDLRSTIYDLRGDGIWVGYFPDGLDSVPCADGARLLYRDAYGMRTFGPSEIDAIAVPGFGTVITVLLDRAADTSETFSLILPSVDPPQAIGPPASLRTFAVTTVHRTGVRPVGEPQSEASAVMRLTGQALSAAVNGE